MHFLKKASMGTEADSAVPSWKPEAGVVPVGTLGNSEEPSPGGPPAAEVRKVPSVGRSALLSEGAAGPGVPWGRTPREEGREAVDVRKSPRFQFLSVLRSLAYLLWAELAAPSPVLLLKMAHESVNAIIWLYWYFYPCISFCSKF